MSRLVNHWANVNSANANGQTPLHFAAIGDNTRIVKLLLDLGSDPNYADHDGNTPVHISLFLFKMKKKKNIHS